INSLGQILFFAFQSILHHPDLHSFPTRRSSDLHVINWHNNSANNSFNPDPRNWVGYGERTNDEMSKAWVNFYYMTDDEYKSEVRSEEHTSELQSRGHLVCRLLLEKKKYAE